MLSDFFRINMPYGMKRNEKNEWIFFNREYVPIGFNSDSTYFDDYNINNNNHNLPYYTKYKGITEKLLLKLACRESSIRRDEQNKINMVWFYHDGTNPVNVYFKTKIDNKKFEMYFEKIKLLSKLRKA